MFKRLSSPVSKYSENGRFKEYIIGVIDPSVIFAALDNSLVGLARVDGLPLVVCSLRLKPESSISC